jgi:hypothetical protein
MCVEFTIAMFKSQSICYPPPWHCVGLAAEGIRGDLDLVLI